jgi:hypothetical protein
VCAMLRMESPEPVLSTNDGSSRAVKSLGAFIPLVPLGS